MTEIAFIDPSTLSRHALEEGTALAPRFDAAGLVTAIAVDAQSREVLMLAHMNAEALRLTIETGVAHYFSRSRGKIWKKGETSGETQTVVEIRLDCDQDAVLLAVTPQGRGAACHSGRRSCFFRRVALGDGAVTLEDAGTPQLFDPKEVY
jgi:phosphoribosyl-AMP cyclohydrolase